MNCNPPCAMLDHETADRTAGSNRDGATRASPRRSRITVNQPPAERWNLPRARRTIGDSIPLFLDVCIACIDRPKNHTRSSGPVARCHRACSRPCRRNIASPGISKQRVSFQKENVWCLSEQYHHCRITQPYQQKRVADFHGPCAPIILGSSFVSSSPIVKVKIHPQPDG